MALLAAGAACGGPTPAPRPDAAPREPAATVAVPAFRALGTEPFWALAINQGGLRFTTPGDTAGARFPAVPPEHLGDTLHWSSAGDSAIDVRVWPARCGDGMSDREWTHEARVTSGRTAYRGCAAPAFAEGLVR